MMMMNKEGAKPGLLYPANTVPACTWCVPVASENCKVVNKQNKPPFGKAGEIIYEWVLQFSYSQFTSDSATLRASQLAGNATLYFHSTA